MKVLARRSILVFVSFTVLSFVFAYIAYAEINPGAIEGVWLFDEGGGDVAKDSSGNNRHGAVTGAMWVNGKFGKAIEFNGTDTQVVITGYNGIGGTDPRSTVLWFSSPDVIEHSWVKWGINVNTQKYYIRGHVSGGEVWLRIETAGGQHYGGTNVCDGEWHHLAVVFPDGSDSCKDHLLYVDGVLETNTGGNDVGVDTDIGTTEVHIGAPLEHHVFATGMMDEVAIFNVALTEDEINEIMTGGLADTLAAVEYTDKLAATWASIKVGN